MGDERAELGSTAGYAAEAERLTWQYESVTFEEVHAEVLAYLLAPAQLAPPCRVADIGAGTGRDAAALAARGYSVVAVEPVAELRAIGERLHSGSCVQWVAEGLPELAGLSESFGMMFLTAVWMHLDGEERARGMARVAGLLAPGGRLFVTLRHGPVPAGRRMFEVTAGEVVAAGAACGLSLVYQGEREDRHGRDGVWWSNLVLERVPS
jgi:SAM-dependent methyltransferase